MTTLRIGQKVTIQQGELEVTGELTCARVYLKGGDPNGYVLSPEPFPEDRLKAARITRRDWEPKKQTPEELIMELTNEKPTLKPPMVTHHTSVYEEWAAGITGKYKAWEAQEKQKLQEGDWVLVKDEELTWLNEDGDPEPVAEEYEKAYRGHRARVVYVYSDGDVTLCNARLDTALVVSPRHLTKEDN